MWASSHARTLESKLFSSMLLDASRKASFSASVSLHRCLSIASSRARLPDAVVVVEVPCVEDACAGCTAHDEGCVALEITVFGRKILGSSLSRLRILNGKPAADNAELDVASVEMLQNE